MRGMARAPSFEDDMDCPVKPRNGRILDARLAMERLPANKMRCPAAAAGTPGNRRG
jgi:hypothetical protein